MGEPERSDDVESGRRSSPRFPADLLGQASVRLLGGSEVTLINFSERGILFQSETRLLVGARGTIRIVVGSETTIAAGTVVRSLVQGMASGKLAFHTALALDQPLAVAAAIEARERARIQALPAPEAEPEPEPAVVESPVEEPPVPVAAEPPPAGKFIEKRSHRGSRREADVEPPPAPVAAEPPMVEAGVDTIIEPEPAPPGETQEPLAEVAPEPPAPVMAAPITLARTAVTPAPAGGGFADGGFDGGSFGWSDPVAEPSTAGLSVLFVSTTKERTARLQGILAAHRRDIVLTTVMHSQAEAIVDLARQHDVLLFDFAIGPDALERTLKTLRASPLGASIAIYVPQQTALPPAVSSLANACVVDTTSANMLASALRDAAWTPWQPVDAEADADPAREGLFWKAFDALPVPVLVVDATGTILHANGACTKLAAGVPIVDQPLASIFVAEDGPAIAKLIADGLAGGYEDTPVFTAPADGQTVQVVLQALSVLPGAAGRAELALRCELRANPAEVEPPAAGPDLAAEIVALTEARDELARIVEAARDELAGLRQEVSELRGELAETRAQGDGARRERDELRGQLETAHVERDQLRGQYREREERPGADARAGAGRSDEARRARAPGR